MSTGKSDVEERTEAAEAKKEPLFTKRQLLVSERFSGRRDLLKAVLSENRKYSIRDTESIMEKFMKGKVK